MTCRRTRLGSAVTSFAMLDSGIAERQVLSTFHELQREGRGTADPTNGQMATLLADQRALIEANPNLSEARRNSLYARLDEAAAQPMDGRTFYAARRVLDRARRARTAMDDYYDRSARVTGESIADVRTALETDMAAAHADRALAAPAAWRAQFGDQDQNSALPLDRITAYAMHQAEQRAATVTAAAPTRPIVTRQPVISSVINTMGYDPTTGRLEVELHSAPGVPYAYRIDQSTYDEMTSGSVGSYWSRNIRGNPDYRYSTTSEATDAGTQTQCPTCGQFAGTGHACPARGSSQERAATERRATEAVRARRSPAVAAAIASNSAAVDQERARLAALVATGSPAGHRLRPSGRNRHYHGVGTSFSSINLTAVQAAARQNDVTNIPVSATVWRVAGPGGTEVVPTRTGQVTGRVNVTYNGRGRGYTVNAVTSGGSVDGDGLRCTCSDYRDRYDCVHVRQTVQDVQTRINQDSLRERHGIGEAIEVVTADLAQDRSDSVTAQASARATWGEPEVTYADNPAAFQEHYKAAKDKIAAGQNPVTYMTENATDGMGARDGGRAFGVELEFDIAPGHNRATALAAIGRDLYAAGLTSGPRQGGYHGAQRRGYTENHRGGWSFEDDCTVAGELVSPIMYDTPETWENLQKACDIIKRHGGVATVRAGSHVHVGAGNYDHTVENHNRLVNSFAANQDVLYRLSTNPERGTHRGPSWCAPNRVPSRAYRSVSEAQGQNHSHNIGLNLQSVTGRASDHVEFRTWDATMDPAVIQTQIKVSLAVTEAAFRDREHTPGPLEPLGSHRSANRAARRAEGAPRRMTGEAWHNDTASYRRFADQMFRRAADKEQVTALFAATTWQGPAR